MAFKMTTLDHSDCVENDVEKSQGPNRDESHGTGTIWGLKTEKWNNVHFNVVEAHT